MGRGFFAGTLWGAVVGIVVIALASQLTARRELTPRVAQTGAEGPAAVETTRLPETAPAPAAPAPADGVSADASEPPATPADEPPVVASAPEPAAEPVVAPEPAPEPAPEAAVPATAPATDAPAAPIAAEAPAAEPAPPSVPATPPSPPSVAAAAPAVPADAPSGDDTSGVTVAGPVPAAPAAATPVAPPAATPPARAPDVVTGAGAVPAIPAVPDSPAIGVAGTDEAAGGRAVAALAPAEAEAPASVAADAPPAPPPVVAEASPEPEPAAEVAPDEPAGTRMAVVETPPTPGFQGAAGVKVNRFPQIGEASQDDDAGAAQTEEAVVDPDAPALVRFAMPFENPALAPLVSVVIVHAGGVPSEAEARDSLPANVTVAVPAGSADAAAIAAAWRKAGREVVMIPSLPSGAAPTDVEQALQVNFAAVPEAVAMMDSPELTFQSQRDAVAQVVLAAADTGHGLLTYPKGLNTAQRLADRAEVPALEVFRVIDEGTDDAAQIRRTLDQAAFRARQQGAVVLVGHFKPATIEALSAWVAGTDPSALAIAPVSVALTAG